MAHVVQGLFQLIGNTVLSQRQGSNHGPLSPTEGDFVGGNLNHKIM